MSFPTPGEDSFATEESFPVCFLTRWFLFKKKNFFFLDWTGVSRKGVKEGRKRTIFFWDNFFFHHSAVCVVNWPHNRTCDTRVVPCGIPGQSDRSRLWLGKQGYHTGLHVYNSGTSLGHDRGWGGGFTSFPTGRIHTKFSWSPLGGTLRVSNRLGDGLLLIN